MLKHINLKRNPPKLLRNVLLCLIACALCAVPVLAAGNGNVAGAVENTWKAAAGQIKSVTNNVIFPVIDTILTIFFFIKIGLSYFDFRKSGQFEWSGPAILFACLVFTLTAPMYIWGIIGI